MTRRFRQPAPRPPRGITLLEVLISIGILAIGLSSVVALVPAGHSQATRAVVLDRASILAANVLADAATFGLFRSVGVRNGASRPLVIDAAATSLPGAVNGDLGPLGIYATAPPANVPAPAACENLFLQLRDDITVTAPAGPDDLPTNLFVDGARAFEGRMTALLCLQSGTPERASVVVFHRRDPSLPTLAGTITNLQLTISTALGTRSFRDVVKPGVVVWDSVGGRFHQLASASIAASGSSAFVTLSPGGSAFAGTVSVTILPDSVGLAERRFVRETAGAYTQ
jgi:hypothetical protein